MKLFLTSLLRQRKSKIGFFILLGLSTLIYSSPLWTLDPLAMQAQPHLPPSWTYLLGTNGQGQDVLAQCLQGAIISLTTAIVVGISVTIIGASLGILSALLGGMFDYLILLIINLFLLIPGLPLAILMASYLPSGAVTIGFVLVLTGWAWNARVIRSQAMALNKNDYIMAAKVAGDHPIRIVFQEILPNMVPLVVSIFIGSTIYAIGAQVGLEFLGLGDVSQVSWGTILYWASNDSALLTGSWWMFIPVGLSIALIGFSLSLLNFGIDEVSNPHIRDENEFRAEIKRYGTRLGYSTPVVKL